MRNSVEAPHLTAPASNFGIPDSEVAAVSLEDDALTLLLRCGKTVTFRDMQPSCCEKRYLRTEDDIQAVVGLKLRKIELSSVFVDEDSRGDVHEVCFLKLEFDSWGHITLCSHNEHNGYYGGIDLIVEVT